MFIIRNASGELEIINEDLAADMSNVPAGATAVYEVARALEQRTTFLVTQAAPRKERNYLVPDGNGGMVKKKKSEMNEEQAAYQAARMESVRAAKKAGKASEAEKAVA